MNRWNDARLALRVFRNMRRCGLPLLVALRGAILWWGAQ